MWKKIKKIYNKIWLIGLALFLGIFFFFTVFTMMSESANGTLDSLSLISVVTVILSFPGIVNTLAEGVNPQKKTYKLSSHCPNCRHLIIMDMKEK